MPTSDDNTILLLPPAGGTRRKRATLHAVHGDLAVVEDPFEGGYTIAVPATSKALTAWRFETAEAASEAAEKLAGLADWSIAGEESGWQELAEDRTLAQRVVDTMRQTSGAIAPTQASYPDATRTGRSYTKEYDEQRKLAKREARRKKQQGG